MQKFEHLLSRKQDPISFSGVLLFISKLGDSRGVHKVNYELSMLKVSVIMAWHNASFIFLRYQPSHNSNCQSVFSHQPRLALNKLYHACLSNMLFKGAISQHMGTNYV